MKKIPACLFIAIVIAILVSCASTTKPETVDYSSVVYSGVRGEQPVYAYSVLDESLRNPKGVYTIPFTENAVEVAKVTKTMRVYFMAGDRWLNANGVDVAYIGDSTLVVFPDGQTMLIDGGRPEYLSILKENLKKLGIEKLDYVMISHWHIDHHGVISTANGILAQFPTAKIIWSGVYNANANKNTIHNLIKKYGLEEIQVKNGDSFYIGDVRVDIYNPPDGMAGEELGETKMNNASIAAKFTYGDFKALFCGDLYVDGEWRVIGNVEEGALDADMIKANHHGRDTSNSKEWAEATTPRVVVSASIPFKGPYYQYSKVGGRVFSDYQDEYVRVVTDGYNCEVTTTKVRENDAFAAYDQMAEKIYPWTL